MKKIFLIATLVAANSASALMEIDVGSVAAQETSKVTYDKGQLVVTGSEAERAMWDMDAPIQQVRPNAGELQKTAGDTTCTHSAASQQTICVIKIVTAKKVH